MINYFQNINYHIISALILIPCFVFFSSLWLVLDDHLQNSLIKLRPFVWSVMQTWPYAEKSNRCARYDGQKERQRWRNLPTAENLMITNAIAPYKKKTWIPANWIETVTWHQMHFKFVYYGKLQSFMLFNE